MQIVRRFKLLINPDIADRLFGFLAVLHFAGQTMSGEADVLV